MNPRLLVIEAILTILAVTLVFLVPVNEAGSRKIWFHFGQIARKKSLSIVGVGLLALSVRAVILPIMPVPEPRVHDEFSYLLAADTFASGRVTNPTHPLWQHFESFHINQQPTYSSMYPPAQALVLALGKLLTGYSWVGVWLSSGLMCAALCWMLQGWLPARWALLGGLIAVLRIATLSYWGNSYWGGSVAALGGLLFLGAIPGLRRHPDRVRYYLLLGVGIITLINSRPYEGLLLCIATFVAIWIANYNKLFRPVALGVTRYLLALVVLLLSSGIMMGYYSWRVTGNALKMPYQVNQQTYAMAKPFLWQTPRSDLQYRHRVMRDFYEAYRDENNKARSSLSGFLDNLTTKLSRVWLFYVGPVLTLSLLGFSKAIFDRRVRLMVITGGIVSLGLMGETWFQPHYIAPMTGLIYGLLLQSMRHLNFWRFRRRRIGNLLVLIVSLLIVVTFLIALLTLPVTPVQGRDFGFWCCSETGPSERSRLLADLTAQGGQHLVIVRYDVSHNFHDEWVYNDADIDKSQVVFARDMGATANSRLIDYFTNRKVWLLMPDDKPLHLKPYH